MSIKWVRTRGFVRYYLIFEGYYPLLPDNFIRSISIIKCLPVMPVQLYNALEFFALSKLHEARIFSEIRFVSKENIELMRKIIEPDEVNVIISPEKYLRSIEGLISSNTAIYSLDETTVNGVFTDTTLLLSWIKDHGKEFAEEQFDVEDIDKEFILYTNTKLLANLHWIKNQIMGYLWYNYSKSKDVLPPERGELIVSETKRILWFHAKSRGIDGAIKFPPPLVIVFPSINFAMYEMLKGFKKGENENILSLLRQGQNKDYSLISTIGPDNKLNEDTITALQFISMISDSIDAVAYLHAQLTFSPVWRLPLLPYSLEEDLGNFSPAKSEYLPKGKKLISQMESFGSKISKLSLSAEQIDFLSRNENQLVILSDHPVEWVQCNEMPLCFSHDVCRIPLNNYNGVISHFSKNQNVHFEIEEDVLSDTLVVMASPEDPVLKYTYKMQADQFKELGFKNYVTVATKSEFFQVIDERSPKILLIDTHGGYDVKLSKSFLQVGKELVYPEDIAANKILAPIVVLSACSTYPLRGIRNQLSEAMFETGCLSVTSSYVPLDIRLSSMLIIRLISNLSYASKNPVHQNWLSFISHLCRTSFFSSRILLRRMKYLPALKRKKYGSKKHLKFENIDVESARVHGLEQAKTMIFHERKEVYAKWKNSLDTKIVPEYLFYTNLGRPDLINFKVSKDYIKKKKY